MNRTLLLARIGLAFLLVIAITVLTGIVLLDTSSLQTHSMELLATLAGSLVTVMVFSVHAVYAHNAQPSDIVSSPNSPGPTAPKAE